MEYSTIDFEKVDNQLFSLLQMLASVESVVVTQKIDGTVEFVSAVSKFRDSVGREIEFQGKRN